MIVDLRLKNQESPIAAGSGFIARQSEIFNPQSSTTGHNG
jgi:hypothetical protein